MERGIEFNHVGLLTVSEIKELFPIRIGDRVKFREAVKKLTTEVSMHTWIIEIYNQMMEKL